MTEAVVPPVAVRAAPARWTPWTHRPTELLLITAWFWTTANRFMHDTIVLYALTTFFAIGAYVHRATVWPVIKRGWPVFLLPLWSLCSYAWSAAPEISIKISSQLFLTVLICCYIAARMGQRAFIAAIFCALTWFEIVSAQYLRYGGDFQGVFQEKNYLALRMSILAFSGMAIFFDAAYPQLLRWAAAPVAAIAVYMVYASHSATSAIAGALGAGIIVGCAWIWRPAKGFRVLIISLGVAAFCALLLVVLQKPGFNLENDILGAFGKDSTLTGREELWDYAGHLIKQKPLLGIGPGGFWLPDRLDAQELLDTHYKPRGSIFVFHNSYIEVTVYLGYIGLALAMIGWMWSGGVNIWRLVSKASLATAFFAALTIVALARSYVESDLWQPFEFVGMIVWIGALTILPGPPAQRWVARR